MNANLESLLLSLKLNWIHQHIDEEIANAARKNRAPHELVERLLKGEIAEKNTRALERRLRRAKLPKQTTLQDFDFNWPEKINADQVRHLFTLQFIEKKANVVFIGNVGLGKTHLAQALVLQACQQHINAIFASASTIIDNLTNARKIGTYNKVLKQYIQIPLLAIDELGYLDLDKLGAEFLFHVLTSRYEKASTIITTNRPYSQWNKTFDNDKAITTAILDRLIHHCETIIIEGRSYRLKDQANF